jgi:hypothetical protein
MWKRFDFDPFRLFAVYIYRLPFDFDSFNFDDDGKCILSMR